MFSKKTSIVLTGTATAALNTYYLILFALLPTGTPKHHKLEYSSDADQNETEVKIKSSIFLQNLVFDFICEIEVAKINDVWQRKNDSTVFFYATNNRHTSAGFCKMVDSELQFMNGKEDATSLFDAFIGVLRHEAAAV